MRRALARHATPTRLSLRRLIAVGFAMAYPATFSCATRRSYPSSSSFERVRPQSHTVRLLAHLQHDEYLTSLVVARLSRWVHESSSGWSVLSATGSSGNFRTCPFFCSSCSGTLASPGLGNLEANARRDWRLHSQLRARYGGRHRTLRSVLAARLLCEWGSAHHVPVGILRGGLGVLPMLLSQVLNSGFRLYVVHRVYMASAARCLPPHPTPPFSGWPEPSGDRCSPERASFVATCCSLRLPASFGRVHGRR